MSIESRVRLIISDTMNIPLEELRDADHLVNDLGFDSLDLIEIVMAVEDEFGLEISDEETSVIFTIQDIIDFVAAKTET